MTRLQRSFDRLTAAGRKALVTYLVAGDPSPECTLPAMHALVRGGVDIIELGVPFSDPEAEGPVIQAGHERALAHGTTLHRVLDIAAQFRASNADTPIALMGYLNPIERMGYPEFAHAAADAGVDALIIVNLPPEESAALQRVLRQTSIELVFLLAPTTTPARARHIAAVGAGFLYYVSLKGITGAGHIDTDEVRAHMAQLRPITTLPIVVGFGIKDAATARVLAPVADGIVIGSALVTLLATTPVADQPGVLEAWATELRRAIDSWRAIDT